MPTIVTHRNPHLDEITCIWLVRRFVPRWKRATLQYVPTNADGGKIKHPDAHPSVMYIGVGRGKFDEHKGGDLSASATTLVHNFIFNERKIKLPPHERAALDELVSYVNDDDHGKLINTPQNEFSISAALAYLSSACGCDSAHVTAVGERYLDGIYAGLIEKQLLAGDWKKAHVFRTRWGKGVAIETAVSAKIVMRRAAREGAVLVVAVNPKNKFRSIRSLPSSRVDLSAAYVLVKKFEPRAEWYLHQSKKMLICGSDVAANVYLSKLSRAVLQKLVSL